MNEVPWTALEPQAAKEAVPRQKICFYNIDYGSRIMLKISSQTKWIQMEASKSEQALLLSKHFLAPVSGKEARVGGQVTQYGIGGRSRCRSE